MKIIFLAFIMLANTQHVSASNHRQLHCSLPSYPNYQLLVNLPHYTSILLVHWLYNFYSNANASANAKKNATEASPSAMLAWYCCSLDFAAALMITRTCLNTIRTIINSCPCHSSACYAKCRTLKTQGGGGWLLLRSPLLLAMPSAGTLKTQGGGGWLLLGHLFPLLCQVQGL